MITVGSLFSGIGGIDLGLERTGKFKTIWFSEVDDYANTVLRKHWPEVPNYGDIRTIPWRKIRKPDMLVGGFPCQDISVAGKGAGIKEGTRSGLWSEYAKAIRILRPKITLIENVPMLANRGLNIVLSDLAKIGYDAEWNIISAASVGANHKRERLFTIAYPSNNEYKSSIRRIIPEKATTSEQNRAQYSSTRKSNRAVIGKWSFRPSQNESIPQDDPSDNGSERVQRFFKEPIHQFPEFSWCKDIRSIEDLRNRPDIPKPLICRTDDGFSNRIHRTKCLGNAVVPQVAEMIGEMILKTLEVQ